MAFSKEEVAYMKLVDRHIERIINTKRYCDKFYEYFDSIQEYYPEIKDRRYPQQLMLRHIHCQIFTMGLSEGYHESMLGGYNIYDELEDTEHFYLQAIYSGYLHTILTVHELVDFPMPRTKHQWKEFIMNHPLWKTRT